MTIPTLVQVLQPNHRSDRAVVIPRGPQLTYAELDDELDRVARLLCGSGLRPRGVVSIVLPNGLESLVAFLAVARAGAVAAPMDSALTVDELKSYMEDADSKLVIVPPGRNAGREAATQLGIPVVDAQAMDSRVELARDGSRLSTSKDPIGPSPEDVVLLLHTSGTTSRPKTVPLSHANLTASIGNIKQTYRLSSDDTSLVVMPLIHVHALLGACLSTLSSGGSLVIPSKFSASRFWQQQQEHRATWYTAVPTIHEILLKRADADGAPRRSFRFIRSCSSPLAPSVLRELEGRFGAPVLEAYGMTEASHQMASNPLPPGTRRPGTVGTATGIELAIMDLDRKEQLHEPGQRGEVIIKGPSVMRGYADNPQANAEAFVSGWFRTGDLGSVDENGYLTIVGRTKELINRGGEKISPSEVDAVLRQHPAVAEAACFGVPDEKYGECVRAAVVLKGDADEESLRSFCREHLAGFKVPDVVYFAKDLPRTATGKIERRRVAAAFCKP